MYTTRWIDNEQDFSSLGESWNQLYVELEVDNPFASFDWAYLWWTHFSEESWRLAVLVVSSGDQIVGIAPLFSSPAVGGGRKYQLLGTGRSDFPDVVVGERHSDAFFSTFASAMKERLSALDVLDLHEVVENKRLSAYRKAFGDASFSRIQRHKDVAPYIALEGMEWDEFLFSKGNKKFRKPMRKKENRLLAKGDEVTVTKHAGWAVQVAEFDNGFELASAIERKSWKFTNGSERINTDDRSKAWFKSVMQKFSENRWLDFWVYTIDGQVKAYAINFNVSGRISAYNSAYDESAADLGPGALMHIFRIRDAFDSKINTYSFLRGRESYKFDWTDKQENLYQVVFSKSSLNAYSLLLRLRWYLAEVDWVKTLREKAINILHKVKRG